jgi:glutamine amidotransferase
MSLPLVDAQHSLLVQSLNATEGAEPTNGDGFGVGWYSSHLGTPGVYHDVRPAWNDENFRCLASHIRSHMFLAHIRAATGSPIQRSNCHPFRHGKWLFQHNGLIPEFQRLRRDLMLCLNEDLFAEVHGSTDSEVLFYLALSYGLENDPAAALAKTVGKVEELLTQKRIDGGFHFSIAAADGDSLYAVRYASEGEPRSLYFATDLEVLQELDPAFGAIPEGSVVVVSEPLTPVLQWNKVHPGTLLTASRDGVQLTAFGPP